MKNINNIFEDNKIKPEIRAGLQKINFKQATKVQNVVIPKLLNNESVAVQAATGSGKTHAYLIPILNMITEQKNTQAVVTAPSRELAMQLYQVARQIRDASNLEISISLLAGGNDRERQIEKIKHQKPQLIIATPGRLADFVNKKIIILNDLKIFVIDEADMTLDMGFLSEIDKIISRLPKNLIIGAFSATIPVKLKQFLKKYLANPKEIVIDNPAVISPTIKNDLLDIGSKDRKQVLYKLLTMGQPYLALVFANTKQDVDTLVDYLQHQGLKVAKIHGGIKERERKQTLRQIRNGQFQYVVASDLVARGLDIDGVSLVINYQLPKDLEFVIHRVGRTGRNGLDGLAITLIREEEMPRVLDLEKMGVKFDFVELKNNELVPRTHYHRRSLRTSKNEKLDPKLIGYAKKARKKRKPGYKRKIKQAIAEDARQKRKIALRHEIRAAKRKRRNKRIDK